MDDCVFCKIAAGKIPSYIIHEDDEFMVILDRFPAAEGHTLVIVKRHAENIYEIKKDEGRRLFELVSATAGAIKTALKPDGLNVISNNGKAAGQSVGHFHIHLIPRREGDGVTVAFPQNDPPADAFINMVSVLREAFDK